jgi:predicted lipoprotein with Yx(FWY)xxD motif
MGALAAIVFSLLAGTAMAEDGPLPPEITVIRTPAPTLLGDVTGVRLQGYDAASVFADARGMTLYIFDRDTNPGVSTCVGACARLWHPAAAPATATKALGDWTVIVSAADETRQWAYKGKPLYTYAHDTAPGDALGDGVDGTWHMAVKQKPFRPAEVTLTTVDGRPVLADAHGMTLYTFDGDEDMGPHFKFDYVLLTSGNGPPIGHCINSCAKTWRALLAPPDAKPPAGDWTLVPREDDPSKKQWSFRKYPLYTYAGDTKPGDANGVDLKYGPDYAFSTMFRLATTESSRF